MSTYKVEVEFIAQVEQLKSQLNQAMAAIKGTDAAAATTGTSLDRMGSAGAAAGQGIKKGAEDAKGAMGGLAQSTTSASDAMSGALTGLLGKLVSVAAAWKALKAVWGFGEMGIEFNAAMETAQLGIGSLIAAQAKLVDATGQELKGREALNAALVLSSDQMQKLKIAGLETVATTQQLVVAYQQAVGVGLSVGMNLDEIREITIKITQAAQALGLPMNQLAEEVRDLLQGNINPRNTRIATALKITNEEVRKWQAAGGHTLADELNKRMEAFGLAGENAAKTWSGVTSNVVEASQTMAGAMTQPLFDRIKDGLQNALKDAFNLKEARISDAFSGLVEAGQVTSEALGELFQEALGWVVQGAKDLSAWFKENRKEVIEIVGDAKAWAEQLGGILKMMVSIVGSANDAQTHFGVLKTFIQMAGFNIAIIRDVLAVVAAALESTGTFLLQGVLGPIQPVLIGIGEAMNFLKKGSGETVIKVAEDMQKFLDAGYAGGKAFVQPLLEGKGAVAQYGAALMEAKAKAEALGEANKKAAGTVPTVLPRPRTPEAANLSGIISAAEIEARLAALKADAEERATLEQQKQHALSQVEKQYLVERARLMKEASEGKFDGNQTGLDALWAANIERREARKASIEAQFKIKAEDEERAFQAKIGTITEEGWERKEARLRAQLAKDIAAHERANGLVTGSYKLSLQEQTAFEKRLADEKAQDLLKAEQKLEMSWNMQKKMMRMSMDPEEEIAHMRAWAESMGYPAAAIQQFSDMLQMNIDKRSDWLGGWKDGIKDWVTAATDSFMKFKGMATQVMNGVEGAFTRGLSGMLSGQMTFSQGLKAIWQGIVQTVAQAVAQLIARWLIMKIVGAAMTKEEMAQSAAKTGASLTAGAAAAWEAYGAIPFVGAGLALAQIALMEASVAGVGLAGTIASAASGAGATGAGVADMSSGVGAVATVRDVGGLVTKPEFTWLAKNGIPEVVAPESDFKDWARSMIHMGANLQANIGRNDRMVMDYSLQAASYAGAGVEAQRSAAEAGLASTQAHFHFPNAVILDSSDRGLETLGKMAFSALQTHARRNGQVIEPGQLLGARI